MSMTKEILISNAVTLLGHAPIISLENADKLVTAAIQAYDLLLPEILSENNWRFAAAIAPLTLSVETAPAPWGAVYNLPSGFLKLLRLYPNIYEFDIYNNSKLYTVLRQAYVQPVESEEPYTYHSQPFSIEYIFQPTTNQLPARFTTYFIYAIASYLALSNAQRPDYAAFLTSETQKKFAMAAASEAQNRPQYSQVLFPVLANRNIGGFIGNSSGQG